MNTANIILSNLYRLDDKDVQRSILLYKFIRELYDRNHEILKNQEFMWAYSAFYGLTSHYKKEDLPRYFEVMTNHFIANDEMSIENVVEELKTEKSHYVFASKLMNFVNDEKYPIIDGNIIKVFHFKVSEKPTSRYQTINDVYHELHSKNSFNELLAKFHFSGIGLMKQIDIVVWNLARKL